MYHNLRCTCGHDGIGRHARFRFSCREAWGFESLQAHQKTKSPVISMVTGDFSAFSRLFLLIFVLKMLTDLLTTLKKWSYDTISLLRFCLKKKNDPPVGLGCMIAFTLKRTVYDLVIGNSPLTRRSVKQRSVGSTHIKMSSTAVTDAPYNKLYHTQYGASTKSKLDNPSVSCADSALYTREPLLQLLLTLFTAESTYYPYKSP